MIVYRITGRKNASDISGFGAAKYGGRWNKKGTLVLYTGESKEISLLETIVHTPPMIVPLLSILSLKIPKNSITKIDIEELPLNWKDYPAPYILAQIGENWVKQAKTIALKVPSCIIQTSHNYVLNTKHPKFKSQVEIINIEDFHFDTRLNS